MLLFNNKIDIINVVFLQVDFGPDNIPGYRSIINLSMYFVSLCEQELPLNSQQVNKIIELWNKLSDYDKLRTKFPQRYAGPGSGRFKSPKKQVALGVTSIERYFKFSLKIAAKPVFISF